MQYHGTEEGGLPCRREFEGEEVLGTIDHAGTDEGAPETVTPVERYVRASSTEPPKQLYRAKRQAAFFVIGDASGKGKGNAVVEQYGVVYESGAWNLEWRLSEIAGCAACAPMVSLLTTMCLWMTALT